MKQIDIVRPGTLSAIIGPAGTLKRILKNRDYFLSRGYDIAIFNSDTIITGKQAELPTKFEPTTTSLSKLSVIKSKLRLFAKSSFLLSYYYLERNKRHVKDVVKAYLRLNRNPDCVVFHSDLECYYYLKYRTNTNSKVVLFYHTDGLPYTMEKIYFPKIQGTRVLRSLETKFRVASFAVDKNVFISSIGRNGFLNNFPDFEKSRTTVILNGIDDYTDEELTTIDQMKKPSLPKYRLVCTGTINSRKGQRIILEAMSKLPQDILKNICVNFVGDGPERVELQQYVDTHDLKDHVEFSGSVDNRLVYKYLTQANIYILMSHNEGLPISIIEAMRAGLPVISTKIAGIPELVDSRNGILITPNVEELYHVLINIDNYNWAQMGLSSYERFKKEFTFERMRKEYCDMIDTIV